MPPNNKRRAREEHSDSPQPRRRRSASRSSEEDSYAGGGGGGNGGTSTPLTSDFSSSHDAMVKKLVRLALSSEVSRKPIRRQEITDKVLGLGGRNFKRVFEDANKKLREVFGMELTELPRTENITLTERRAAQQRGGGAGGASAGDTQGGGSRAAAAAAGTNQWILTSVLPEKYRAPGVLQPPRLPSVEAEASYAGLATFIVGVIMLTNGQRISEGKLESYLQRAGALEHVLGDKTERVLKRLTGDGYIRRVRETQGGDEQVDYVLGTRAKAEIGPAGVASMIRKVYNKRDGEELAQLNKAIKKSLGNVTLAAQEGNTAAADPPTTRASGRRR